MHSTHPRRSKDPTSFNSQFGVGLFTGRTFSTSQKEHVGPRSYRSVMMILSMVILGSQKHWSWYPEVFGEGNCGNSWRLSRHVMYVVVLRQHITGHTDFSKIDLWGAYNLVWIQHGDEWKTAFQTRYGHFEYKVMPFSLINALVVFKHMMNDLFLEYLDHCVVI